MVRLLVHGGAANIPKDQWDDKMRAVVQAARSGCFQLMKTNSAVESVVTAVSAMEDDCSLNAGLGSSLTAEGTLIFRKKLFLFLFKTNSVTINDNFDTFDVS
jgi:isoaspartyl peptidase/L-asparaginase-like protein (Ntn-hydrolase superfamily)